MKRRNRWVIVGVFVIVVAAVAAGAYVWFGRDSTTTVHYLTSKATKGTLSQTVQADFTLSSATGTTSIALGGGAASDTSSSASPSATSALEPTTEYAAYTVSTPAASDAVTDSSGSPSPSPSPTETTTPTPTPTPTPTKTGFPTPTPSPSSSTAPSGGFGGASGGATGASGASSTSTSSSSTSTFSGVVTRVLTPAGAKPVTLQRLLSVSGKPVFAFVSSSPLWKNLSTDLASGDQSVNVATLQRALKQKGYYTKTVNGRFTSATKKAFKKWQKAQGMSATGIVSVTRFAWMPVGSVLTSWTVNLGSHVSSGTALASVVSPSRLSATAQISQADIADLKLGQKAEMAIDGYESDAFTGRVGYISSEPDSSSGTTSSSSSTQYSITVSPQDLPKLAKSGMTGTLTIVIKQRTDVITVPTTAVTGSSGTSFVRIMQNGQPVFRQVQTGMATSSATEITSGLAEGETVITGQYTEGASTTGSSSTQQNRSGGSILQGGGAFPAGGPPSGGFPGGGPVTSGGGQ